MKKNYFFNATRNGFLVLMVLVCGSAFAQTYTWKATGGVDNNWANSGNWTNANAGKTVTASSGVTDIVVNNTNQIKIGDLVTGTTAGQIAAGTVVNAVNEATNTVTLSLATTAALTGATNNVRFTRATVSYPGDGGNPDSAIIAAGSVTLDADISISQLSLNTAATPAQGVLTIPSGRTLNIANNSSALFIRGGKLTNNGTLNLAPQSNNAAINCQLPVNNTTTPDYGYDGTGILTATTSGTGGFVTFNNLGASKLPVINLNATTTTITILGNGNVFNTSGNTAAGNGKIGGTGVTFTASSTGNRLFNISAGTGGTSSIEVLSGTVITMNSLTDGTSPISVTSATSAASLVNNGTIIMNGDLGASAGVIGSVSSGGSAEVTNNGILRFPVTTSANASPNSNAIGSTLSKFVNTGTIETNTGSGFLTDLLAGSNTFTSGTLSPGGNAGKSVMNISGATVVLGTTTLRMNVSGGATAGTDYDQINASTTDAGFNISGAKLDFTGIYTPGASTSIDIVKANGTGTITGTFTAVPALPTNWALNYATSGVVKLVYTDPSLGVKKQNAFDFAVYPNPVRETLNIQTQESLTKAQIIDASGKVVLSQNNPSDAINVASLSKGIYMLRLTSAKGVSTSKILKK
ncbi:T9SS type A sorting domain-containing protein [Flavobacterium ovatum]|uniref:beta strand repeat-containing protein n=1 Tax=Flavobacterium ovatum TaxID=1928857 RepID=UPI00344BEFF9